MEGVNVIEKIQKIETELEVVKRALIQKPDLDVDERIWKKIAPLARKIRQSNCQRVCRSGI